MGGQRWEALALQARRHGPLELFSDENSRPTGLCDKDVIKELAQLASATLASHQNAATPSHQEAGDLSRASAHI